MVDLPSVGSQPEVMERSAEATARAGFRHVVVCLDRSEAAERALPLAAHLARMEGANLSLLQVLESQFHCPSVHASDALSWEIARQEAHARLDHLAEEIRQDELPVDVHLVEGLAAMGIATAAEALGADLLVLSTHGEGGLGAWTLGGTAAKILALARGAVLVVPAAQRAPRVPFHRLLVPLDGSLRGEAVLALAARLARRDGAEIVLAHVVAEPTRTEVLSTQEDLDLAQELSDRLTARIEVYLQRIRARLSAAGARARTLVTHAIDHREGLIALTVGEQVDLVVVSAHGSVCSPRRHFGSVTEHLLAHSPAPVLVLQDLPGVAADRLAVAQSRLPSRSIDDAGDHSI